MPQVDYIHPELRDLLPILVRVGDAIRGPQAIRNKEDTYLPRPNADDESKGNKERYKAYLNRAIFYGVPGQTLEGLVSEVFTKEPVITLPDEMEFLLTDVNASGLPITQQAKSALRNALANGSGGLFTDYPQAPAEYQQGQNAEAKELSKLDVEKLGLRPRILKYLRADIINWRKQTINGKVLLTLVVLKDKEVVDDDGFEAKTEERYRVLRLNVKVNEPVYYYVEIWKKGSKDGFELVSTTIPTDGWGNRWDVIPFEPFGWEDNDISPNTVPLEPLVELALGHYRNSADYEDSCYLVGQPTPVYTGLTEDWVKDVMKGTAQLGSRGGISLGKDMDAKLLQAEPNIMPKEAMEHKEKQMVALNAKLVQEKEVQQSATEASIANSSKTSVLGSAAMNVSLAYESSLKHVARFMKIEIPETEEEEDTLSFELNTDFDISKMTAQERQQLLQEWMSGGITLEEYRHNLKKAGVAYLEDEKFKDQLEADGGLPGAPTGKPGAEQTPPGKPGDEETEPGVE